MFSMLFPPIDRVSPRVNSDAPRLALDNRYRRHVPRAVGTYDAIIIIGLPTAHVKANAPWKDLFLKVFLHYLWFWKYGARLPATAVTGMVCKMMLPGPVTRVLNSPSPPKSTFFTPGTVTTSIVQVSLIAAR